jgi:hypothetical protein
MRPAPDLAALRAQLREFLAAQLPGGLRSAPPESPEYEVALTQWREILLANGSLAAWWPEQHGGNSRHRCRSPTAACGRNISNLIKQCSHHHGGHGIPEAINSPGQPAGARSFVRTQSPGQQSAHLPAATTTESAGWRLANSD